MESVPKPDVTATNTPTNAPPFMRSRPQAEASNGTDRANGYSYPDAAATEVPSELCPSDLRELLEDSALTLEVIAATGYATITESKFLDALGFPRSQWIVPLLLCPIRGADGEPISYQIKPHQPRKLNGKVQKYETRAKDRAAYHVNPTVRHLLRDPTATLYITEGNKKADSLAARGCCAISLSGVWNWRGTDEKGGNIALASFNDIAWKGKDADGNPIQRRVVLVFDSDAIEKPPVNKALKGGGQYFAYRGAKVFYTRLPPGPDGSKTGVDDFFARGGTPELLHLHTTDRPPNAARPDDADEPAKVLSPDEIRRTMREAAAQLSEPHKLQHVKDVYRKWLHIEDDGLIEVVLGTVAANLMDGDPVWLMVIDRSGGGKTEHIQPLAALPFVHLAATVTEPALLSGTPQKDAAKDSKGGLLREIGSFGFLVLKDFTSILSMHHVARTSTIAALREIYDGHWSRRTGSDGGRELEWRGKLAVIGACTEAIDNHHAVIGSMGERFAFYRLPKSDDRQLARKSLSGIGKEGQMREELARAVAGLFAGLEIPASGPNLSDADTERLISLAIFTARCRSAVERDRQSREIEFVYKPEAPTRIAKVFARIFHGMSVIGVERSRIWQTLLKMALDSMHKTRCSALTLLADSKTPMATAAVALALDMPTQTVRRALEELNTHGILTRDKEGKSDVWAFSEEASELWEAINSPLENIVPAKSSNDISKIIKDDLEDIESNLYSPRDFAGTEESARVQGAI
jgi:DNA-binding transcriptional ArsR family regulator